MTTYPDHADRREEINVHHAGGIEQRERIVVDEVAQRRSTLYRVGQIIWLITGGIEALIGLRVLLKFMAANPEAGFARFVYWASALFVAPFNGLTLNPSYEGMVLELTSLIAIIVYALLAWLVVQAVWLVFFRAYTRSLVSYRRVD